MSAIPISNNPTPPKSGDRVMAKHVADLWQAVKRLAAKQEMIRNYVIPNTKLAPLTVTLKRVPGDPETYEVFAQFGHVVPRHNSSSETGEPIEITDLPTPDAPLVVIEDDKLWVELTIDPEGKCTYAVFNSGQEWPEDTAPELIGGDDQTGEEGQRYIRIAEVIANPDSTTDPPQLQCNQLHTGHIDHFQPELVENTTTSPSGGEARVLKAWNSSAGRWDLRYLTGGPGVTITENADSIEVKAEAGLGDSFAVAYWTCSITLTSDPPVLDLQRNDGTPDHMVFCFKGIAYLNTAPEGFPEVFTTINVPLYHPAGTYPTYPFEV